MYNTLEFWFLEYRCNIIRYLDILVWMHHALQILFLLCRPEILNISVQMYHDIQEIKLLFVWDVPATWRIYNRSHPTTMAF
jgi:hypothetical protein